MPFSPSDFEWWMWLLFMAGAGVACAISYAIAIATANNNNWKVSIPFGLLAFAAGVVGAGCFLIAVIRFVKWVWNS
jgi:hypothetical protein